MFLVRDNFYFSWDLIFVQPSITLGQINKTLKMFELLTASVFFFERVLCYPENVVLFPQNIYH